jgi:hypothetical protein
MTTTGDPDHRCNMTPDEALALLKEGNERYLNGAPIPPQLLGRAQRLALASKQEPFCVLIGCSDSRVSPELLFGRGLSGRSPDCSSPTRQKLVLRNAPNEQSAAHITLARSVSL